MKLLKAKIKAIEDRLNKSSYKISIKKLEVEIVSRCYRLYKEVKKEFRGKNVIFINKEKNKKTKKDTYNIYLII